MVTWWVWSSWALFQPRHLLWVPTTDSAFSCFVPKHHESRRTSILLHRCKGMYWQHCVCISRPRVLLTGRYKGMDQPVETSIWRVLSKPYQPPFSDLWSSSGAAARSNLASSSPHWAISTVCQIALRISKYNDRCSLPSQDNAAAQLPSLRRVISE